MKIGTSTKKLAIVVGLAGICSFGLWTPSVSAQPNNRIRVERRRTVTVYRNRPGGYRPGGYRPGGYRPNRPGGYRPGTGYRTTTYVGRVTSVSGSRLDIVANGRTYNVYAISRLPYRLNRGDYVRVTGVRRDNNDIRDARVSIVRNR